MPTSNPIITGTAGDDSISVSTGRPAQVNLNGVTTKVSGATTLSLKPLAGADNVQIGLVSTSAAAAVNVDLALANGQADGQADTVTFQGNDTSEFYLLTSVSGGIKVAPLGGAAPTTVTGLDAADRLVFNLGGGSDIFDASRLAGANGASVVVNGGAGDDTLFGAPGASNTLDGGAGFDQLVNNGGNDVMLGGDGDDHVEMDFDKGGHVVADGGALFDTLELRAGLNAGPQSDIVTVFANGGHVAALKGGATVDAVDVERITIQTFGGSDAIKVGDLTSTSARDVQIDLGRDDGVGPDGAVDTVILTTPADSTTAIAVGADGQSVTITYSLGGAAVETVTVTNMDADDILNVDGTALTLRDLVPALSDGFLF